jgi:SAM-dependent methyltransferase
VTDGVHPAAAHGFDRGAADYAAARPGYPDAAVDLVAAELGVGPGRRVLDLAAGTGILTRALVARGADVVAVEPVAGMRAELRRATPGVEVLDGRAEALPLDDASVDVVTVAQAFHWFDPAPALAEIARVLRPGGGLALIWNGRDESVGWVARWTEIVERGGGGRPYTRRDDWADVVTAHGAGRFTPLERRTFPNPHPTTPEGIVARAASTSWVAARPDDVREAVLDEVRDLVGTHPDLAGRDELVFPHDTHVWWCRRT